MKKQIVTISREFGSGGRTVGKRLAQRLGVPYYDKELVKQVAVETGFAEGYIEQAGEYAPVRSWLSYAFSPLGTQGAMEGMSADDFLWAIQRRVILDLAGKGPCVIVGRCADYILKDRADCLNVFVHAGKAFRSERVVRLYGQSEQAPEKRLEEKDKRRKLTAAGTPTGTGAWPSTTTWPSTAACSASTPAWRPSCGWRRGKDCHAGAAAPAWQ